MRKICNPRNFKSHVSPHEFLQAVVNASKRKFKLTEQVCLFHLGDNVQKYFTDVLLLQRDPFDFLSWLLNALHMRLKAVHKKTIVHKVFRVSQCGEHLVGFVMFNMLRPDVTRVRLS